MTSYDADYICLIALKSNDIWKFLKKQISEKFLSAQSLGIEDSRSMKLYQELTKQVNTELRNRWSVMIFTNRVSLALCSERIKLVP